MSNPLQRLTYLPWLKLFQVAGITGLIVKIIDVAIAQIAIMGGELGAAIFSFLAQGALGLILSFGASVGIGALGIYVMERWFRQISISSGVIWALAFCLAIVFVLQAQVALPVVFLRVSYDFIIGMVLGAAIKGRKYWRY